MKLISGKKYYVYSKKNKAEGIFSLNTAMKNFVNKSILVKYDGKFFYIIDERLRNLGCFNGGFYPYRFIIEPQQLELEF